MGPFPSEGEVDPQLINAGKQTVTVLPGASIVRLGAVVRDDPRRPRRPRDPRRAAGRGHGDLANWTVPGKLITGIGGAMDLAAGARRVIVLQSHVSKDGEPKLVAQLTLPADRARLRRRVITELGVFDVAGDGFVCVERAPGVERRADRARHRRAGQVLSASLRKVCPREASLRKVCPHPP